MPSSLVTWWRVLMSFLYKPTKFQRCCSVSGMKVQAAAQMSWTEVFSITIVTPSCWNTVWYGTEFHPPLPLSFTTVLGTIHYLFWQSVYRNSWSCQSPRSGHKVPKRFFWKDLDLWKQNKNTFDIKSLNYKCEGSCSKVLLVGRMNQTEVTQKTM